MFLPYVKLILIDLHQYIYLKKTEDIPDVCIDANKFTTALRWIAFSEKNIWQLRW